MLTRRGSSTALAILSLIAATGARGQVYIPPPDDLVEPQSISRQHAAYLPSDKALMIFSVTSSLGLTQTTS